MPRQSAFAAFLQSRSADLSVDSAKHDLTKCEESRLFDTQTAVREHEMAREIEQEFGLIDWNLSSLRLEEPEGDIDLPHADDVAVEDCAEEIAETEGVQKVKVSCNGGLKISSDSMAEAEEIKVRANKEFAANNFRQAITLYTEAIELNPNNHAYYANRSFAHIKLENYGSAIMDADKAIELDATYIKGLYRRGTAYLALGQLRESRDDFKAATLLEPQNKEACAKLSEVEKALETELFHRAIGGADSLKDKNKLNDAALNPLHCRVEESYVGPQLSEDCTITAEFVEEMLEHFKNEKRLHKKYVLVILWQAYAILQAQTTVVDISVPEGTDITVCGDVHGQFYDLLNIFEINGRPSESNPYLFNGDFVDRGSFSVETVLALLAFKVLYPNAMHLNRGNHETKNMNMMYGFEGEVKEKCGAGVMTLFTDLFQSLPLVHIIGGKIMVTHGGLFSRDATTLADVREIDRHCEPPDAGPMTELLWSDPSPAAGRSPSQRGVGVRFGPDVAKRFLDANDLTLLIRSHECKDEGYEIMHGGCTITVFSAPNYCDQMGNKGAFIRLGHELKPQFTSFSAVSHPPVPAMKYAGMGGFNFLNFLR